MSIMSTINNLIGSLGSLDKIGAILLFVGIVINYMSYEARMRSVSIALMIAGAVWSSHGKWSAILS